MDRLQAGREGPDDRVADGGDIGRRDLGVGRAVPGRSEPLDDTGEIGIRILRGQVRHRRQRDLVAAGPQELEFAAVLRQAVKARMVVDRHHVRIGLETPGWRILVEAHDLARPCLAHLEDRLVERDARAEVAAHSDQPGWPRGVAFERHRHASPKPPDPFAGRRRAPRRRNACSAAAPMHRRSPDRAFRFRWPAAGSSR